MALLLQGQYTSTGNAVSVKALHCWNSDNGSHKPFKKDGFT